VIRLAIRRRRPERAQALAQDDQMVRRKVVAVHRLAPDKACNLED